jgi:hypothetical protein
LGWKKLYNQGKIGEIMADLLKEDETKKKVLKIELPDGTEGEIPIQDSGVRTEIFKGYSNGGTIETFGLKKKKKKKKKK